ncbi:Pr6Pr family membrane protein [Actinomadura kijaniata]|uniref:Pr6Pr family membrane protein n=1 Tax=Actinomadura kijaniata TaxID=46161 RepID=UPI003F1BA39A
MRPLSTCWRLAFGALALWTMAFCFAARHPSVDAVDFFSYFTVLSNVIGGGALLAGAVPGWRDTAWADGLRGAAALYLVITGAVYALVLDGPVTTWAGWVQHRIMPVVAPLDWLALAPRRLPARRTLACWLAFPLLYLVYVLAHGAATHWYPYPFLDARRHGLEIVTGYTAGIGAAFVAVAALLLGGAGLRRRAPSRGTP